MKSYPKTLCFLLVLCCSLASLPALAMDPKDAYQRIKNSIKLMHEKIFNDQQQLQSLQKKVKQADLGIQTLTHQLESTQAALQLKNTDMQQLKTSIKTHQASINQQQSALRKQLQLSYMLGQSGHIKILLSHANPHAVNRLLNYTHYLHAAHAHHIHKNQQDIKQLHAIQQQASATKNALSALFAKQNNQKNELKRIQTVRTALIASTAKKIHSNDHKLKQLITDKKNLEKLIKDLQTNQTQPYQKFAGMRGHLPWPLKGHIATPFNSLSQGHLKHDGMVIAAPSGTQIKAVAPGQVVFAEWLKGFGLLVIINHGDGYMTLYARNNSLYQKAGDQVQQGDLIATVGQSGGFQQPGLYFAIRHNTQPLDPTKWCQPL